MQLRNSPARYGAIAQLFHWVIVALIVTQFILANKAESLPLGLAKLATLAQHKSVGMTILMLAILRLVWRMVSPAPAPVPTMARWQLLASHASHYALYGLILVIPLVGWLMSSAKNYSVSWFNLFSFPDLVGPNEELFNLFRSLHQVLAIALFWIAIIHLLAALKHHVIDRDDVLRRMLPVRLRHSGEDPRSP